MLMHNWLAVRVGEASPIATPHLTPPRNDSIIAP